MSRDEITAMAREAGAGIGSSGRWLVTQDELDRFAALVAAKEREAFALECIDIVALHGGSVEIEAAIRARCKP